MVFRIHLISGFIFSYSCLFFALFKYLFRFSLIFYIKSCFLLPPLLPADVITLMNSVSLICPSLSVSAASIICLISSLVKSTSRDMRTYSNSLASISPSCWPMLSKILKASTNSFWVVKSAILSFMISVNQLRSIPLIWQTISSLFLPEILSSSYCFLFAIFTSFISCSLLASSWFLISFNSISPGEWPNFLIALSKSGLTLS
jgi:hypothetical protein